MPKHLGAILIAVGFSLPSQTAYALDSWTCSYPAFGADRMVSKRLEVQGEKLVDKGLGPTYDILENNKYAVIAAEHYAKFDAMKGAVRIFSSTVIIDKTFGKFIYTVGEIGDEPGFRTGRCEKDLPD